MSHSENIILTSSITQIKIYCVTHIGGATSPLTFHISKVTFCFILLITACFLFCFIFKLLTVDAPGPSYNDLLLRIHHDSSSIPPVIHNLIPLSGFLHTIPTLSKFIIYVQCSLHHYVAPVHGHQLMFT